MVFVEVVFVECRLRTLVDLLVRIAGLAASDPSFAPVVFPAHPRTHDRLSAADLLSTLTDAGIDVVALCPTARC